MKKNNSYKLIAGLGAALLIATLSPSAYAGPGPQMLYPVKTLKQAEKIKVGTSIAISCGNCHGVTIHQAAADRSYLHGYTCPLCQRKFHVVQPGGGGRSVATGSFVYQDDSGGTACLSAAHL